MRAYFLLGKEREIINERGGMPSVVVVDDELEMLNLLCQVVGDAGYSTRCVSTPDEALTLDFSNVPDVFLIDMMLPGLGGIDLARHLHARGFGKVPMIAMSAAPAMLRSAEASGLFFAILGKPFDLGEMLETIAAALDRG